MGGLNAALMSINDHTSLFRGRAPARFDLSPALYETVVPRRAQFTRATLPPAPARWERDGV